METNIVQQFTVWLHYIRKNSDECQSACPKESTCPGESWDHFSEADEMLWPSFFPVKHLLVCAILVNKTFGINLNNFWNIFPLTSETSGTYRCSIPACTIFHCPTTYKCKHLSHSCMPLGLHIMCEMGIPFIYMYVPHVYWKIGAYQNVTLLILQNYSSSSRRKKRPGYSERI